MGKRRRSSRRRSFENPVVWQYVIVGSLTVAVLVMVGFALQPKQPPVDADRATFTPLHLVTEPTSDPIAFTLPPSGASVYVIGDSWAAGQGVDPSESFVNRIAAETGWEISASAQGGTGYRAVLGQSGAPFPTRADDLPAEQPAMIIVQGGFNDAYSDPNGITEAAGETIAALRVRYPESPIIIVGPSANAWPVYENLTIVDAQLNDATAGRPGVWHISPLDEAWVTAENVDWFIDAASAHPSADGQKEYANRLLASLQTLR